MTESSVAMERDLSAAMVMPCNALQFLLHICPVQTSNNKYKCWILALSSAKRNSPADEMVKCCSKYFERRAVWRNT